MLSAHHQTDFPATEQIAHPEQLFFPQVWSWRVLLCVRLSGRAVSDLNVAAAPPLYCQLFLRKGRNWKLQENVEWARDVQPFTDFGGTLLRALVEVIIGMTLK